MTQTILLVGATGMLGGRIAHHLLEQPDSKLRMLVRDIGNNEKTAALHALVEQGAELIEGDLSNPASLDRATQGVDVIVSAVQGGPDVIIDGQVGLAEVGKRNGVRRILPSDFGLDLFKATPGEHAAFNWRAAADEQIAALGMEHIHVLQGGFMDLFGPGSPLVDYHNGVVSFWGDGTQPIEVTTVEDTARMTAHIALDRSLKVASSPSPAITSRSSKRPIRLKRLPACTLSGAPWAPRPICAPQWSTRPTATPWKQ